MIALNPITSVQQLTQKLDTVAESDRAKVMKQIQISAREFLPFATWNEECYTRNCIARTDEYELILLCWEVGAKTPIHGHGGEDCWVYQIQGTVEEMRYEENGECLRATKCMELTPGKLTYMCDRMGYHSIENTSNHRAMTLHIYASPIDKCKVYNDDIDCFEVKEMSYHTFQGEELAAS